MSENILYILMRTDLSSLNAGKAMAQASHASNAFIHTYANNKNLKKVIADWSNNQGFGTVLVLGVTRTELVNTVSTARQEGFPAEVVDDVTYPYQVNHEIAVLIPDECDTASRHVSGDRVTIYRNETTCGYIFGTKEALKPVLGGLKLHP